MSEEGSYLKTKEMMADVRRKEFPLSPVCIGGTDVELYKIPGCCVRQPKEHPTKVNTLPSKVHTTVPCCEVREGHWLTDTEKVYGVLHQQRVTGCCKMATHAQV